MIYSTNGEFTLSNMDYRGIARPSAILEAMEEAANKQLEEYGPSNETLWNDQKAFILSRITIKYYDKVTNYQKYSASTWVRQTKGYTSLRYMSLCDNDEIIAEAASEWALIDTSAKKLLKMSDITCGFEEDSKELSNDFSFRFNMPDNNKMVYVGDYTVTYEDADQNGHMNNAKYLDMLSNFLTIKGKRISEASISYLSDAPLCTKLSVFLYEENRIYYFTSKRIDKKNNIIAKISLTDI